MIVVVNGGADSGVVLVPLVSLDSTVLVSVTKVLEELQEDLVFAELARLHLGVHTAVVDALKVFGSDLAGAISVELEEGLIDHSLSLGVELALFSRKKIAGLDKLIILYMNKVCVFLGLTPFFWGSLSFVILGATYADADKELVEVDVTITIGVEESHESVSFVTGDSDLDLAEARPELLSVDLVVTIEGVEVSEGSAEGTDGLSTTGLDLLTDSSEDYNRDRKGVRRSCCGKSVSTQAALLILTTWHRQEFCFVKYTLTKLNFSSQIKFFRSKARQDSSRFESELDPSVTL